MKLANGDKSNELSGDFNTVIKKNITQCKLNA